jgi:hypothetical protein
MLAMKMKRLIGLVSMFALACGDDGGAPADTDETSTSMGTMSTSTTLGPTTTGDPTLTTTGTDDTGDPQTGSTGESTGDPGSTGEGSSSSGGIEGIAMPFRLVDFASGLDQTPFPDADVCFVENSSCDVSDNLGEGELIGPPDTNLTIDISGGGVFPTRFPVRFPDTGLEAVLATLSQINVGLLFASLEYKEIPTEGTAAVLVVDENLEGLAGATINIDDATLTPIYFEGNAPNPDLTATEAGLGIFVEVPAGDYEVWVDHPSYDCPPSPYAWPGSAADRAALDVVDDTVTINFVFECTPN